MAKKKKAKRMGRPPLPETTKSSDRFAFRASTPWKDWLGRFAAFMLRDKADLITESLENYAKLNGFEKPPKR